MRLFSRFFLMISIVVSAGAHQAQAEVFKWQDEHTKVSWTFPDRWRVGNDQKPDDVITIWAPGAQDNAFCRMRVREDRRFVIYPRRLDDSVQRINYSRDFWDGYIGQFDNAELISFSDEAGLGLAFASYATMSFISEVGPRVQKKGIALAGVYNDTAYVFECSADVAAYHKWHRPFLSVLHSVEMHKIRHERTTGHYRNFLADPELRVHNAKPQHLYIY